MAEGNFSKVAQGFVRGKGFTVDRRIREVKGEYVYVTNTKAGKNLPVCWRSSATCLTFLNVAALG